MKLQRILRIILLTLLALLGGACSARGDDSNRTFKKSKYSLAIAGYNYTNSYIDSFSVNGAGGGNLFLSGPTTGGGKSTCCASYYPKLKHQTVHVTWQSSGCKYIAGRDSDGTPHWYTHPFFKEADATVIDASSGEPQNLEVHIYPDDRVEAYVTSEYSRPHLSLDEKRKSTEEFPRCPNDKGPSASLKQSAYKSLQLSAENGQEL